MGFLSLVGNSFGCSASGERLVSAARDGDLQEARALLEYNPRLARYSTFGGRNSPLHYAAAQGHHEIVSLLLESGVEINLRNYRGQTALMQACQYGYWEVVQTLILFNANVSSFTLHATAAFPTVFQIYCCDTEKYLNRFTGQIISMVEPLSILLHCMVMPDAFVLFLQITCQAYQISSPRQIIDHLKKIQLLILIMMLWSRW
jgi:hypothetical protein